MGTVKTHIGRLLAKLDARDRAQLVIAAYDAGLARCNARNLLLFGDLPKCVRRANGDRAPDAMRHGPPQHPGPPTGATYPNKPGTHHREPGQVIDL
jgi:hypothetical protein